MKEMFIQILGFATGIVGRSNSIKTQYSMIKKQKKLSKLNLNHSSCGSSTVKTKMKKSKRTNIKKFSKHCTNSVYVQLLSNQIKKT